MSRPPIYRAGGMSDDPYPRGIFYLYANWSDWYSRARWAGR